MILLSFLWATSSSSREVLWSAARSPGRSQSERAASLCALAEAIEITAPASLPEEGVAATVARELRVARGCAAVQLYNASAQLGNATAQFRFAVLMNARTKCARGSVAEMLWLLHFSATGGHRAAQLALGYRYLHGINVRQSCESAARWYEVAANGVVDDLSRRGALPYRNRDEVGPGSKSYTRVDAAWTGGDHLMSMYQHAIDGNSDAKTVVGATMAMGRALYYGMHGTTVDQARAASYFEKARAAGHAPAARALAHMYLHGHGVPQSNETALALFREAGEDGEAKNGLGVMQLVGAAVLKPSGKRALELITAAAKRDSVTAHYNLGVLHLLGPKSGIEGLPRNWREAARYFMLGANAGDTQSMQKLAMMQLNGLGGIAKSCDVAVATLKKVAERGSTVATLEGAFAAYRGGRVAHALLLYARAAEMGYQLAQSNAAYLLELRALRRDAFVCSGGDRACARRALVFHKEAARQGSVTAQVRVRPPRLCSRDVYRLGPQQQLHAFSSLTPHILSPTHLCFFSVRIFLYSYTHTHTTQLRIGDFNYYGSGGGGADYKAAAEHYRVGEAQRSAEAMFNLGWMCQHGIGVEKDLHLSRRYFDLALQTDLQSWAPVRLAIAYLELEWWLQRNFDGFQLRDIVESWDEEHTILALCVCLFLVTLVWRCRRSFA